MAQHTSIWQRSSNPTFMTQFATNELWSIFDARRVKAPELKGLDASANGFVGYFKNRRPVLSQLKAQAARIEVLEPEIRSSGRFEFQEKVAEMRVAWPALTGWSARHSIALWRSSAKPRSAQSACGRFPCSSWARWPCARARSPKWPPAKAKRSPPPWPRSLWGWAGSPVHVITVNDYLVQRDAEEMSPVYEMLRPEGRARRPRNHAAGTHRSLPPRRRLLHQQGARRRLPARPDPARQPPHQHADGPRPDDERRRTGAS